MLVCFHYLLHVLFRGWSHVLSVLFSDFLRGDDLFSLALYLFIWVLVLSLVL